MTDDGEDGRLTCPVCTSPSVEAVPPDDGEFPYRCSECGAEFDETGERVEP